MSRFWCVVPAGGVGKRMASQVPKQYLALQGKTIAETTLEKLLRLANVEKIIVAVSEEDEVWPTLGVSQDARICRCPSGAERVNSVLNGLIHLSSIADSEDWVLVHDIARPCVRIDDVLRLMQQASQHQWGGLLGVPVSDTLKKVDELGGVTETIDRQAVWRAFTPQMFKLGQLKRAIEHSLEKHLVVTDEASAIEMIGGSPLMVEGATDNIKITLPQDLELGEHFLKLQESGTQP